MTLEELTAPDPAPLPDEVRSRLIADRDRLVEQHNIVLNEAEVHWTCSSGGLDERDVTVSPIEGEMDYWAAVHEIGHIVLRLPTFVGREPAYENEFRVWAWSLDNACITPSVLAARCMIRMLFTHTGEGHPAPTEDQVQRLRDRLPQDDVPLNWRNAQTQPHAEG
jgi:hypothetical protein